MWSQKYSRLWCIKDYHPSLPLCLPADYIISTCDHRNTVDYDVLKIIILPSRYILPADYIINTCDHRHTVDYDVLKIIILPSSYIYLLTT
jgi:hypothetical protein